jgi:hypothetical protein
MDGLVFGGQVTAPTPSELEGAFTLALAGRDRLSIRSIRTVLFNAPQTPAMRRFRFDCAPNAWPCTARHPRGRRGR